MNAGPSVQGARVGFRGANGAGFTTRDGPGDGAGGGPAGRADGGAARFGGSGGPGAPGGFGEGAAADPALVGLLRSVGTRWVAATTGAQGAAALELAGAGPVMAIGGFTGSDPVPSLQQFEGYAAGGEVRYFVAGGGLGRGGAGGRGVGSEIATWVQQHYSATTVGGQTVYDLTRPIG